MMINYNNIRCLIGEAICHDDQSIWMSTVNYNGLYRYDIQEEKTYFLGAFPKSPKNAVCLHTKAVKAGEKIFFLPQKAGSYHVYDIEKNSIVASEESLPQGIKRNGGFLYENCIYCISEAPRFMIYKIDIQTNKIVEIKIPKEYSSYKFCSDIVCCKEKAYFACVDQNIILEYDCKSSRIKKYELYLEEKGFGTICHDGNLFWLSNAKEILRWEMESGKIQSFKEFPKGYGMTYRSSLKKGEIVTCEGFSRQDISNEMPFCFSAYWEGDIWLFPFRTNVIIRINCETGKMEPVYWSEEEEDAKSLNQIAKVRYTHAHYIGSSVSQSIWICSTKSRRMWKLDIIPEKSTAVTILAEEPTDLVSYITDDFQIISEEYQDKNALQNLIKRIIKKEIGHEKTDAQDCVGEKIYQRIKG